MRIFTGLLSMYHPGEKIYLDDYEDKKRRVLLPTLGWSNHGDVLRQRNLSLDDYPICPAGQTEEPTAEMIEKYGDTGAKIAALLADVTSVTFEQMIDAASSAIYANRIGFNDDAKFKIEVIANATHDHPDSDVNEDVLFIFDSKIKVKSIKCKVLFMFNSELVADTVDVAQYICIYGDLLQVRELRANYGAIAVSKYDIERLCHTSITLYSPKPLTQQNESTAPSDLTTEIINLVAGHSPVDIDELMPTFTGFVDALQAARYDANESVLFPSDYYDPETDEVDELEDVSTPPELAEITPSKDTSRLGAVNTAV